MYLKIKSYREGQEDVDIELDSKVVYSSSKMIILDDSFHRISKDVGLNEMLGIEGDQGHIDLFEDGLLTTVSNPLIEVYTKCNKLAGPNKKVEFNSFTVIRNKNVKLDIVEELIIKKVVNDLFKF